MILFLHKSQEKLLKVSWINDYTKNLYVIEEISVKILYFDFVSIEKNHNQLRIIFEDLVWEWAKLIVIQSDPL